MAEAFHGLQRTAASGPVPTTSAAPEMPRWIVVCAWASFLLALPTVIWRVLPGVGVPLGTPAAWRELQHQPGEGTWYVLALSTLQLVAAACCLLLSIDVRRIVPHWAPAALRRAAPYAGGILGLLGAAALGYFVTISIIAWDRVDPFAGQPHGGWAWLCLACYLLAVPWPAFLAAASIGYLRRRGRA